MTRWRKGNNRSPVRSSSGTFSKLPLTPKPRPPSWHRPAVTLRAPAGPLTPTRKPPTPWPTTQPARAPRHCSPTKDSAHHKRRAHRRRRHHTRPVPRRPRADLARPAPKTPQPSRVPQPHKLRPHHRRRGQRRYPDSRRMRLKREPTPAAGRTWNLLGGTTSPKDPTAVPSSSSGIAEGVISGTGRATQPARITKRVGGSWQT
jgi:hypothetical protein